MRRRIIPYNPILKRLARNLRNNLTLGEVLLWQQLKGKKVLAYDFDRQKPINNFIVDFYCKDLKLAIEIDGSSHNSKKAQIKDLMRQNKLESLGVNFLRFKDEEVRHNMEGVIALIKDWIKNQ